MAIRVLLVDDHSVVREGLRIFLRRDRELEIVGEAINGVEAVHKARELRPDIVLMDLLLPKMDGIAAIAAIRAELPSTEVIALTSVIESGSVVDAMKAGAIGYLFKDTQAADLRRAIKSAAAGQVQLSHEAAVYLMNEVQTPETPEALTEREMDVLRLLARGQSNREIASNLHIVENTVKTHIQHVLFKLGVESRTQAVLYAMRIGLISLDQGRK